MRVDKDLIRHVAGVARLNLTEKEVEEFIPQMEEVLGAFSQLMEVDTSGLSPSFQPVELKEHIREDVPEKCLTQEEALSNAEHKDGYIKGPKAI
jgi:aspartyl-tRNA(Asn)/glutamyl-tRNA(Gln) amidotransferase subunit C